MENRETLEKRRVRLALAVEEGEPGAEEDLVAKEVLERKERLIEKSGGKLSEGAAYERVFKQDPALYRSYVREVEVSTAVT